MSKFGDLELSSVFTSTLASVQKEIQHDDQSQNRLSWEK